MRKWYESRLEMDKSGGRKTTAAVTREESNEGRNESREKRDKMSRQSNRQPLRVKRESFLA